MLSSQYAAFAPVFAAAFASGLVAGTGLALCFVVPFINKFRDAGLPVYAEEHV